jgi:hypothetical protein
MAREEFNQQQLTGNTVLVAFNTYICVTIEMSNATFTIQLDISFFSYLGIFDF